LSDDAVPVLLARLPTLEPRLRVPLAEALLRRADDSESFVGWNASRARARELLRQQHGTLLAAASGG
jgi:hypothetical protein